MDVAVPAGDLVLDPKRELSPCPGVFHVSDCGQPLSPGARLDNRRVFRQWRQRRVGTERVGRVQP